MITTKLTGDRGRHLTAAITAVLLLVGTILLIVVACSQRSAPEPPVSLPTTSTAPSTPASTPSDGPATTSPSPSPSPAQLVRSVPVGLKIPSIGVTSKLAQVGLDPEGSIAVPRPGPHYDEAAWFQGSPTPGQVGPATIVGHVDSAKNGPSVFFELGGVKAGAKISVERADGTTVVFTVYQVQRYHKDAFPTDAVYANTDGPELRLITCGGTFDSGTGHYKDNVVVYARMTSTTP